MVSIAGKLTAETTEESSALTDPSVVRWRLIASLARVMAVEKPMQYSVL